MEQVEYKIVTKGKKEISKGQVSRSAYLEYVYFKDTGLYLHWYDNEPKDIKINTHHHQFYVYINGCINYYVSMEDKNTICNIYEYDSDDYQNYRYYASYDYEAIAECGYWDNDNHYIKKTFEDRIMREYSYEGKNGNIDNTTKKRVYEGEYEYNPKQHFPRKNKETDGQGSQVDNDMQNNANTENQKNNSDPAQNHSQKKTEDETSTTIGTTDSGNGSQKEQQKKEKENANEISDKKENKNGTTIKNDESSLSNGVANTTDKNVGSETPKEIPVILKEENAQGTYLINAQKKQNNYITLTWTNSKSQEIPVSEDGTSFVVESNERNYLLKFDNDFKKCYIIEYKQKDDLKGYCYYTKHEADELKECGLVKNNEYVCFKMFNNGKMTEYTYSFENEQIVIKSKTEVYEGNYQNNPCEHYPRVVLNALEILPELPRNAKEEIVEYIKKIEQGQNEIVVKTGTELSQIDCNVGILIFEESYMNELQNDFVINEEQFPYLRKLILESNCQNSRDKIFGKFEISGCLKLEEIEVKNNSFCWYMQYVFKDLPSLKSIKLSGGLRGILLTSYGHPGQSSLEMINLPSLTTIIAESKSLYFVSTITIKNVPNVKRADLGDASQGLIKCEVSENTSEAIKKYFLRKNESVALSTTTQGYSSQDSCYHTSSQNNNISDDQHINVNHDKTGMNTSPERGSEDSTFVVVDAETPFPGAEDISSIANFEIIDNNGSFDSLEFTNWASLISIKIGNNCCLECKMFSVNSCPKLTEIEIGYNSFTIAKCVIEDCPHLKIIDFGENSFNKSRELKLKNLSALTDVTCLGGNFCGRRRLILKEMKLTMKDLPKLERMSADKTSFEHVTKTVFRGIPKINVFPQLLVDKFNAAGMDDSVTMQTKKEKK